jgi:hypothetical protein
VTLFYTDTMQLMFGSWFDFCFVMHLSFLLDSTLTCRRYKVKFVWLNNIQCFALILVMCLVQVTRWKSSFLQLVNFSQYKGEIFYRSQY